jgi:hypothetical protein
MLVPIHQSTKSHIPEAWTIHTTAFSISNHASFWVIILSRLISVPCLIKLKGFCNVSYYLEFWKSARAPLHITKAKKTRQKFVNSTINDVAESLSAALNTLTADIWVTAEGSPKSRYLSATATTVWVRKTVPNAAHRRRWLTDITFAWYLYLPDVSEMVLTVNLIETKILSVVQFIPQSWPSYYHPLTIPNQFSSLAIIMTKPDWQEYATVITSLYLPPWCG